MASWTPHAITFSNAWTCCTKVRRKLNLRSNDDTKISSNIIPTRSLNTVQTFFFQELRLGEALSTGLSLRVNSYPHHVYYKFARTCYMGFFKTLTNNTFSAGLIMKLISFSTKGSPSLYRSWKLSNKTTPCCGQSRDGRLSGITLSAWNLTKMKVNTCPSPDFSSLIHARYSVNQSRFTSMLINISRHVRTSWGRWLLSNIIWEARRCSLQKHFKFTLLSQTLWSTCWLWRSPLRGTLKEKKYGY